MLKHPSSVWDSTGPTNWKWCADWQELMHKIQYIIYEAAWKKGGICQKFNPKKYRNGIMTDKAKRQ